MPRHPARSSAAAHRLHAKYDSRELTAPARKKFMERFESEADPNGELSAKERARRAEHLKRAYFLELSARSAEVRRARRGQR